MAFQRPSLQVFDALVVHPNPEETCRALPLKGLTLTHANSSSWELIRQHSLFSVLKTTGTIRDRPSSRSAGAPQTAEHQKGSSCTPANCQLAEYPIRTVLGRREQLFAVPSSEQQTGERHSTQTWFSSNCPFKF